MKAALMIRVFLMVTLGSVTLGSVTLAQQPGDTAPAAGAQGTAAVGGGFSFLMPLLVMFGIFYFLLIRPQQKQQKARQAAIEAVKKGDRVVTGGGIHGRVMAVEGPQIILEIADNVRVKVDKAHVTPLVEPTDKNEKK